MVMSRVEAIGWRDDVSSLEHTPEQLSHECRVLTCLFGQFFGTKGMVHCLQDLEDFLSLQGEGCASSQEGRNRIVICAEPLDGRNALFPEPVKWLRFDVGEQGTLYFRFDFHVFFLSRICGV